MKFLKNLFSGNDDQPTEPEILLEAESPLCPITAIVEQDDRVAYLYLWGAEHTQYGTKTCWIRNLKPAPQKALYPDGMAPIPSQAECKFPEGQAPLDKEKLHIVWTEEGDGAALFEGNELLTIIPSWGSMGGLFVRNGPDKSVFATVGLSLFPQPQVELHFENADEKNRVELGVLLTGSLSEEQLEQVSRWISGAAAIPWKNISWLGEGHTVNFSIPGYDQFTAALLTNRVLTLPEVIFEDFQDSSVNFLWMVSITEAERQFIIENGSEEFIGKINLIGSKAISLDRKELV